MATPTSTVANFKRRRRAVSADDLLRRTSRLVPLDELELPAEYNDPDSGDPAIIYLRHPSAACVVRFHVCPAEENRDRLLDVVREMVCNENGKLLLADTPSDEAALGLDVIVLECITRRALQVISMRSADPLFNPAGTGTEGDEAAGTAVAGDDAGEASGEAAPEVLPPAVATTPTPAPTTPTSTTPTTPLPSTLDADKTDTAPSASPMS